MSLTALPSTKRLRAWSPAAFASLRDCTVAEAASALATAGRLQALPMLLARHPWALLPSMLDVMSAVPETVDAKELAPLLRQASAADGQEAAPSGRGWRTEGGRAALHCVAAGASVAAQLAHQCFGGATARPPRCLRCMQVASLRQPPPLPREPDWVESAATAAALREAGHYALLLATEPMCAASQAGRGGGSGAGLPGWRPPTERQLAAWVCERAQQLDAATGAGRSSAVASAAAYTAAKLHPASMRLKTHACIRCVC